MWTLKSSTGKKGKKKRHGNRVNIPVEGGTGRGRGGEGGVDLSLFFGSLFLHHFADFFFSLSFFMHFYSGARY